MPSSRKIGAAIATDPAISSPSLVAMPVITIPPSAGSHLLLGRRGIRDAHEVLGQDLLEHFRRREREQHPTRRPRIQGRHRTRVERYAQRLVAFDLVEAHARQPDPSDDDRRLARLLDEHPQGGVGVPDQTLAADVGPAPDEQLRTEAELAPASLDEAELPQRSQVAVDGRERHLQQRAQLVGTHLAAIGHGQEQAQATGE